VYLVGTFAALAIAPLPDLGSSAEEIAGAVNGLAPLTALLGGFLQMVAYTALLVFLVGLSSAAAPHRIALVAAEAAFALASVAIGVGLMIGVALAPAGAHAGAPLMLVCASVLTWVSTFGFGVGLATVGLTALKNRALSRWLAWSALVLGALLAVALLVAASPVAHLPATLADLWILVAAIVLLVRGGRAPSAPTEAGSPATLSAAGA
jgi:hypothetical protein